MTCPNYLTFPKKLHRLQWEQMAKKEVEMTKRTELDTNTVFKE